VEVEKGKERGGEGREREGKGFSLGFSKP